MDNKITLTLDKSVIDSAKSYAKMKKISLSKLIEEYLNILTAANADTSEVTPFVKSLSGVIDLHEGYDERKEYRKNIAKKYSK